MRVAFQALAVVCLIAVSGCGSSGTGDAAPLTRLRCGVGPYFPTPGETRKQFDPLFEEMAKQLGVPAEIVVTEDWIGLAEALRARTLDVCWMGPWGYVLARHHDPSMTAIATVKYKDRPIYHGVLLARADAPFQTLEEAIAQSTKGPKLKLSLGDVGSTSGWLVPQAEFQRRGVNPREAFAYSEGALHAAQAVGVVSGQVDIASDYDRHLDVLAAAGRIDRGKLKVLWQTELPNDPIVLRGGLPAAVKDRLQKLLVQMSAEQARQLLPTDYTGFIPSDGSNYATIEASGRALGKLK